MRLPYSGSRAAETFRICPATSVTLTSSSSGREVMIGMSTGSIEAHYTLAESADTIMTPDFRILLAGPGTFNLAIKADDRGDVAVRALAGNTASLIVSELNGDGTYQVKPSEEVLFHNGKLADPDHTALPECRLPCAAASATGGHRGTQGCTETGRRQESRPCPSSNETGGGAAPGSCGAFHISGRRSGAGGRGRRGATAPDTRTSAAGPRGVAASPAT